MISNSALMCKNSSVVCFLNHPLFKKENVPTESDRRVQWWWIALFFTHDSASSYPPDHLRVNISSYSWYIVFFYWVWGDGCESRNLLILSIMHSIEPLSTELSWDLYSYETCIHWEFTPLLRAVNLCHFREYSSKCQPTASKQSTQFLEIFLGTVELLSWNISSFSSYTNYPFSSSKECGMFT